MEDEDSIELVAYADMFVILCIFINTAFIAVRIPCNTWGRGRGR